MILASLFGRQRTSEVNSDRTYLARDSCIGKNFSGSRGNSIKSGSVVLMNEEIAGMVRSR
jgi:hypothetical protein